MAKRRIERLFSSLGMDMERHSTPMPTMPLFQSGIQEPPLLQASPSPRSMQRRMSASCFVRS